MTVPPPSRVKRQWLLALACLLATIPGACGDDDGDGDLDASARPTVPTTEKAERSPGGDGAAFCAELDRLAGERSEAYLGSRQHLDDIERLLAVAPAEVRGDLETFRDYIASDAVQAGDPAAKDTENWPPDVLDAIARINTYQGRSC